MFDVKPCVSIRQHMCLCKRKIAIGTFIVHNKNRQHSHVSVHTTIQRRPKSAEPIQSRNEFANANTHERRTNNTRRPTHAQTNQHWDQQRYLCIINIANNVQTNDLDFSVAWTCYRAHTSLPLCNLHVGHRACPLAVAERGHHAEGGADRVALNSKPRPCLN